MTTTLTARDVIAALIVAGVFGLYLAGVTVSEWIWELRGRPAPRREPVHRGCTRKYPADFKPTN
jgi:hypothetical protein